jgi:hypothetical protein
MQRHPGGHVALAVECAPIRWTVGDSPESVAALLLIMDGETVVAVNTRIVDEHDPRVRRWAARHLGERFALLDGGALDG